MALKLYTSVEKALKLKVRMLWWLIPTFVEVTVENLAGGPFYHPRSRIGLIHFFDYRSLNYTHLTDPSLNIKYFFFF